MVKEETRSESRKGAAQNLYAKKMTASCRSDRTDGVKGRLRINGYDKLADDDEHVATVIKERGPDLGAKPQIWTAFAKTN